MLIDTIVSVIIFLVVVGAVGGFFGLWWLLYLLYERHQAKQRGRRPRLIRHGGHVVIHDERLRRIWDRTYDIFPEWRRIAEKCDRKRVVIGFHDFGDEILGRASPLGRPPQIYLNPSLHDYPDRTISKLLAHESSHVAYDDLEDQLDEKEAGYWGEKAEKQWQQHCE